MNEYWSMNEATFACLHDSKRTLAFRKAIRNSVKDGDIVAEFGAGSGILSMFAIDAGAAKVYAVELDKGNIATLKKTFLENGYSDKIEIIEGDATKVKLPEKVDYIICEMIATGLIEELQIPVMNHVLQFLKPKGKVLLEEYEIYAELVSSKSKFYNKTFNMIRFELPEMRDMRGDSYSVKQRIKNLKFSRKTKNANLTKKIEFIIKKSGEINAVRISGKTTFSDNSVFENSTAYDFPIILPIDQILVKKGEKLILHIAYKLGGGIETLKYKIG